MLTLVGVAGFAAVLVLGIGHNSPVAVTVGVVTWGLTFGGAPTLLQTAIADAAGDGADAAQSMLVTVFNLAVAGGGVVAGFVVAVAQADERGGLVVSVSQCAEVAESLLIGVDRLVVVAKAAVGEREAVPAVCLAGAVATQDRAGRGRKVGIMTTPPSPVRRRICPAPVLRLRHWASGRETAGRRWPVASWR